MALILAGLLLAVLACEARLGPRLHAKFAPEQFPWTRPDAAVASAVRAQTERALDALAPVSRLVLPEGSRLEQYVAAQRTARPVNTWPNACLAAGLVAVVQAGGDDGQALETLRRFGDRLVDARGRLREPPRSVEQAMVGPALLELASRPGGERFRSAANELGEFLLHAAPRSSTGTLAYNPSQANVLLVDSLAIACPFLAAYATNFAQAAAADLAVWQLQEFSERAVEPATGLPWHAYESTGGAPYGILGWTRGAGWYAMGLVETLAALPPDHPARPRLVQALNRLTEAVAARQQADGLWRWCLSQPEGAADTSGSALLAWAIERGVQTGTVPTIARRVAAKALAGLALHVDQNGLVTQALGECQAVGHYPKIFGAYPWAQGPAAAALSWSLKPGPTPTRR